MKIFVIGLCSVLAFACTNRIYTQIAISNDKLYGDLSDGHPDRDSLTIVKDKDGRLIGHGRFAVSGKKMSNIKVGAWKEFDEKGVLKTEGEYSIGSFIDCCAGGACMAFYYYRTGQWKFYDEKGNITYDIKFEPSSLYIKTRCGGDSLKFGLIKSIPRTYRDILTIDKIYELQKISFDDSDGIVTYTPLNGELFIERRTKK